MPGSGVENKGETRKAYAAQAERLGQYTAAQELHADPKASTRAVEAKFVTAQDPIIKTANGGRLPTVPLEEAIRLNDLKDQLDGRTSPGELPASGTRHARDGTIHGASLEEIRSSGQSDSPDASLRQAAPPSRTDPLFPPLPLYGPPTLSRAVQCYFFRTTSFFLSLGFLLVVVLGALACSVPGVARHVWMRLTLRDPHAARPFYQEEKKRAASREELELQWARDEKRRGRNAKSNKDGSPDGYSADYRPTEGGPDPLICDIAYYARREGLDAETFEVQTEDGFLIELHHIYDPRQHKPSPPTSRKAQSPDIFTSEHSSPSENPSDWNSSPGKRYPILMMHGLLQSSGAYCCTGDNSLAFYLTKSGYDVWLGNNRCGFEPKHAMLSYPDPRMWAWNIRQMGVFDLAALVSRVLSETCMQQLALVAHSQGTTQTLVALAKEQRPELGRKISVFCALAPAAYAGPLIGKAYFKFMRVISASVFKCVFGIHSFIPFMMAMHKVLPGTIYGQMGYLVFSFLFNWSDQRWDRGLRDRYFQFSPTYVSAESMRWWLGRECFARQKCILATREEGRLEDKEDEDEDQVVREYYKGGKNTDDESERDEKPEELKTELEKVIDSEERGRYAWYDDNFPPLAMWVCGADDLVDGRRLLRRFDRGREPHVKVVHKKIIEGYEHLDVIWAMDSIGKVGSEIKDVVWQTISTQARNVCRVPVGCNELEPFDLGDHRPAPMSSKDMVDSAIAGTGLEPLERADSQNERTRGPVSPTLIDATAGEWSGDLRADLRADEAQRRRSNQ